MGRGIQRWACCFGIFAANGLCASAAQAGDAALDLNYTLASQYLFRGLTQTNGHSAVQGGAEVALGAGAYAGTWLSNISWFDELAPGSRLPLEWDLDAGYRHAFGDAALDLGIVRYLYPGHLEALPDGIVRPDMTEAYAAVTWHALSFKYSASLTDSSGVEHSRGSQYAELALAIPVNRWLQGSLHVGRAAFRGRSAATDRAGTDNARLYSYTDWSLGLTSGLSDYWNATFLCSYANSPDAGYLLASGNLGGPRLAIAFQHSF